MAHRALLLVDLQNDFCAGGALAVPEGDSTVDVANALIDWSLARGEPIVASQDWQGCFFATPFPWRGYFYVKEEPL